MSNEPTKLYTIPKLTELMDKTTLQQIQDWAAMTAGVPILIRDADGNPVTVPSLSSEFCDLISGPGHTNPDCIKSNKRAAIKAAKTGKPVKYICHAGLTQFAAPINISGQFMGTIVIGDRPMKPLDAVDVEKLANKFSINAETLKNAAKNVEIWSEKTMDSTINFLYTVANTFFTLCYQGYSLNQKVRELTILLDISRLLTTALGLQEVLDHITEGIVKALDVKSCTIRLLDAEGVELRLKSGYNLSKEYLAKGPVILEDHPICQSAMKGEVVIAHDITVDPRSIFHEETKREGLRSMLCVGLMVRDKSIGTVHIYTGEVRDFSEDEIELVQSIASHAAAAIERAKLYEESLEKQRIEQELNLAAEIQKELLPDKSPDSQKLDIKAKIMPCRQLSGDLYDFIKLGDNHIGLVIADVSGKGTPGAILMATTRVTIRESSEGFFATGKVIDRVNKSLHADTRPTEFVSMFYGVLDENKLTFTYTNAGHNAPILFRNKRTIFLEAGGVLLGIINDAKYDEVQIKLKSGDLILFYTDGVTDIMNRNKEVFGLRRLINVVRKNMKMSSEDIVEEIYNELIRFSENEPQTDDLTLIVLKVL